MHQNISAMHLTAFFILVFILPACLPAQNVGQKGKDTAVWNYTDINGMKQGRWLKFDKAKKKKSYEGFFINNRPVGEFKRFHPNGKYSALLFYYQDSEKIKAKFYWNTGVLAAEGNYSKEEMKDSVWNFYGVDKALLVKETYKNGKKNGLSTKYFRAKDKSGNPAKSEEIEYKENLRDGIWKQYFDNGKAKLEATYVKDTVDGYYVFYLDNGTVYCAGNYRKGLKHGDWNYKDLDGKKYTIKYRNGTAINETERNKKFEEELKKLMEDSPKLKDPEKMQGMPEQYFMGQ